MITSVIEMLELRNFGHMTTTAIWFESHDEILLVTSWSEIMTSLLLFQNRFTLRRPSVAIFADIAKILTIFTKAIFRDSKNLKNLEITYQNEIYICISWYSKICWFLLKKY